jgi:hypothetical protein
MNKEETLARLAESRQTLHQAIEGLSEEEMTQVQVDRLPANETSRWMPFWTNWPPSARGWWKRPTGCRPGNGNRGCPSRGEAKAQSRRCWTCSTSMNWDTCATSSGGEEAEAP